MNNNAIKTNTAANHREAFENKKLGLSTPWQIYRQELASLFASDKDIFVEQVMEDETRSGVYDLGIKVYNHHKFLALQQLLSESVTFGNVMLRLYVYDMANSEVAHVDYGQLFKDLFDGNDIFDEVLKTVDFTGTEHTYIAFKPKAVQFYADNIQDPYGNKTMLAQDVAKEILGPKCERNVQFTSSLITLPDIKE